MADGFLGEEFVRKQMLPYIKLINLGLTQTDYIFGFMHPRYPADKNKNTIVLSDAKFITKQQYSIAIYELWPLKVTRN
jgi:hypothetical protein